MCRLTLEGLCDQLDCQTYCHPFHMKTQQSQLLPEGDKATEGTCDSMQHFLKTLVFVEIL